MRAIVEKTQATAYRNFFAFLIFCSLLLQSLKSQEIPVSRSSLHANSRNRRNCGTHLVTSEGVISVPVPGKRKGHFGATSDLEKIFSRPKMLLRLENYESVDHRLRFAGIKKGS